MKVLYNDNWEFAKTLTEDKPSAFASVEIPHDWLIHDANNLYETSYGWYRRTLNVTGTAKSRRLYFEGVYQDSSVYVNDVHVVDRKYGYTSFEADISQYVKPGENEILVLVRHEAPNSRWYSGAGIYRNVWLIETQTTYLATDGIYFSAKKQGDKWDVTITAEVVGEDYTSVRFTEFPSDIPEEQVWDIANPYLHDLKAELLRGDEVIDVYSCKVGFRDIRFDPNRGFFLNGRNVKLNGVCLHHDLGCLGAAWNKAAAKRQLTTMLEMGVNSIRTAHNPPAKEFMELCDEMGLLVCHEFIDMWERPMTKYDYARFFSEHWEQDCASWVRRDRNHPSIIMWSIGNEIYDTHMDARGLEVTKLLHAAVRKHDPHINAYTTLGSNYMQWKGGQSCAAEVDLVGYNYGEYLYEEHHANHPDWCIYGSETTSGVKSRGVYHFPLDKQFLTHEDLQCSSLGNCKSGFQRFGAEDVIVTNRDVDYCAGMYIWTGSDYLGEPTPYSTKNAYYAPIDTAGLKKDAYWLYKAAWTDEPVLHILPYWDWNIGQNIDVVVYTNLGEAELFLNGKSFGHKTARNYTLTWKVQYETGTLTAVAGEHRAERKSFGDSAELVVNYDRRHGDVVFAEFSTVDRDGNPVENARDRISLTVENGRLLGFDNGDSTDYDSYKSSSRKLFSGKAVAYIEANGDVQVTAVIDKNDIPVRKLELVKTGEFEVEARVFPENATYNDLQWSVVTNSGIKTNIAAVEAEGHRATVSIIGDGEFRLRCTCSNGKPQAEVISEYEYNVSGYGEAVVNPFAFTPACMSGADYGEVSDGGLFIKGGDRSVTFRNVDFKHGSDTFELSAIHWHTGEPFGFSVNSSAFTYQADFIWMTYQPNTCTLPEPLKGIQDITFRFDETKQDLHFGGFRFVPGQRAYTKNYAADYDSLHGDSYELSEQRILHIGNNVYAAYHDMDFTDGVSEIRVTGKTHHEKDSVHVYFELADGDTVREIIEFPYSEDFITVTKELAGINGKATVRFVFLPGCDFDFDSFEINN